MNKLQITLAASILMFTLQASAQISVSLNLGSRPQYHDRYENSVSYYYLPEIEAYYDVNSAVYIYNGPRGWVRTTYLPEYCRNYDVNRGYRVAVNYTGRSPYVNFNNDRQRYCRNTDRNYREEYYNSRNRRNQYVAVSHTNRHDNRYNNHRNEDNRWNNNKSQHERGRNRGHGDRD
ncbi:MAG: hypothetical protein GZ087_14940 [Flavobacterium sp.]|nr:hypothetical protein [Flavobacterium sp.]